MLYIFAPLQEVFIKESPPSYARISIYMMMSSNGNVFRVTGPLCGEFTGDRWIPHTKASDVELSLICVWINDWVNNREVGDLRRYRGHNDLTVM